MYIKNVQIIIVVAQLGEGFEFIYIKLIEEIKTIWPERLKFVESSSNSVDSSLLKSWGHNGERGINIRINK